MSKATPFSVNMPGAGANLHPDYLMTQKANPNDITFTPQQLKALETMFPEVHLGSDSLSEASIRHRIGQRSVVAFIRDKTRSA